MDLIGLFMFLFSGLSAHSRGATREYHLVKLARNWIEAQSYCREHFQDLATIENKEDWATVYRSFFSGQTMAWVGLHYVEADWKWSLDNTNLYPDGNSDVRHWLIMSVDNPDSNEECAYFYQNQLHDSNCDALQRFVCYDESTKAYIGFTELRTWWSAQSYCRKKHTDLASMRSEQEKKNILKQIDGERWWLGSSRRLWHWSDQTDSIFRNWSKGNPNHHDEDCVSANHLGWHDVFCHLKHPFICSTVPTMKLVKLVLKPEGPVDMNDRLVQEAIRKHTEERLEKAGIQKFRVTWKKQPNGKAFNAV